eukprot:2716630-Lingulodinium_polyedra.AAC.1
MAVDLRQEYERWGPLPAGTDSESSQTHGQMTTGTSATVDPRAVQIGSVGASGIVQTDTSADATAGAAQIPEPQAPLPAPTEPAQHR